MSTLDHYPILDTIKKIASFMKLDCEVEITEEQSESNTNLFVSITTPEHARFLIGKDGQNLKALEHIVRLMMLKGVTGQTLTLDVNDYKKSKALHALELAQQAVDRVRMSQKAEALLPMSPYERRIVHMELASYPDITTESIGEEPQRRVIIKPFP